MGNDSTDNFRPPIYTLRWILLVLKYTVTAILGLVALGVLLFHVLLIVIPLIVFFRGESWGNTGVNPLVVSVGTALYFLFSLWFGGLVDKLATKAMGMNGSKANAKKDETNVFGAR